MIVNTYILLSSNEEVGIYVVDLNLFGYETSLNAQLINHALPSYFP